MSAIFGEMLSFGQADGSEIKLRVFGDEHYARYENGAGYTSVFDNELGRFCYARLSGGALRSSGVPLDAAPPAGIARHLQETRAIREAKANARRATRAAATGGRAEEDEVVRTFGPNQGLLSGRVLATGAVRGLTILVNFQDVTSTTSRADVEAMLNSAGYTRNGNICSVNEYFKRVSSGKLDYTNIVVGPYTLSRNRQFYVDNLLVEEALDLAVADGLDLTQFNSRGENVVDALNILYAGQTQYLGDLWPHNFNIDLRYGSMRTDLYLLTSLGRTPADLSIGTFCHENGHLLCRFPDMYDYGQRDGDNLPSAGIGMYCLMGAGNHLDFGRSPSPVCSYLRDLVGWCDVEIDVGGGGGGSFAAKHGDYNTLLKYRSSKPNEYFVLENRSKMGLDRALPASGLAVYHCDIFGSNELQQGTRDKHYQCALLQADGRRDLEQDLNQGDGSDLFGQSPGIVLSSASVPSTREWDGRDSGLVVSDITVPGASISFAVGAAGTTLTVADEARPSATIPDDDPVGISSAIGIAASGTVARIKVGVDIRHPYVGDLRVELRSPGGRRAVIHARLGGSSDDLVASYDSASPGVLATMVGQPMQGDWLLSVADLAGRDIGRLESWKIELEPAPILPSAVAMVTPPKLIATGRSRRPKAAGTRNVA